MPFANAAGLLCAQLQQAGVVPMLLGAGTTAYARDVHARLRQGCPHGSALALSSLGLSRCPLFSQSHLTAAVVEEAFLDPPALAAIYSRTLLNVHPGPPPPSSCWLDAFFSLLFSSRLFSSRFAQFLADSLSPT